jgi:hypothetical protein
MKTQTKLTHHICTVTNEMNCDKLRYLSTLSAEKRAILKASYPSGKAAIRALKDAGMITRGIVIWQPIEKRLFPMSRPYFEIAA